jgi:hypothetical protein
MDVWDDAVIALAFGVFVLVVVLPLVAVLLFTVLDLLARRDIGWRKLLWLPIALGIPVFGPPLYWLFRPKNFDPWQDTEPLALGPIAQVEPAVLHPLAVVGGTSGREEDEEQVRPAA